MAEDAARELPNLSLAERYSSSISTYRLATRIEPGARTGKIEGLTAAGSGQ